MNDKIQHRLHLDFALQGLSREVAELEQLQQGLALEDRDILQSCSIRLNQLLHPKLVPLENVYETTYAVGGQYP